LLAESLTQIKIPCHPEHVEGREGIFLFENQTLFLPQRARRMQRKIAPILKGAGGFASVKIFVWFNFG